MFKTFQNRSDSDHFQLETFAGYKALDDMQVPHLARSPLPPDIDHQQLSVDLSVLMLSIWDHLVLYLVPSCSIFCVLICFTPKPFQTNHPVTQSTSHKATLPSQHPTFLAAQHQRNGIHCWDGPHFGIWPSKDMPKNKHKYSDSSRVHCEETEEEEVARSGTNCWWWNLKKIGRYA